MLAIGALVALSAAASTVGAATAYAAPGQTDTGSTTANVEVGSAITLTNLTPAFTLAGVPGETPTAPVTMTVTTNNAAGYSVTVTSETATLDPPAGTNTDSIPIGSLEVQGTTQGATWAAMVSGAATLETHTKATPSAEAGDDLTDNYRMLIPFVEPDTYTAVLDYVAITL